MQAGTLAGACGLVLFGTGITQAQTPPTNPGGSLLNAAMGSNLGSLTAMLSGVLCNNRLPDFDYKSPKIKSPHPCTGGPVKSGNSMKSNNFLNHGSPVNSGNIETAAGSTNSLSSAGGSESGSKNNISELLKPLLP
ncbi:hypothetical protein [Streptomyces sp. CT34]|uniref:hypothetical protein n=1 Tax=Streptomyces sp. CT34 TaxID=1553907 RepID=UPI0005BD6889|nr:hypothetical protein [Streptomyces sp. CT34]